MVLRAMVVAPIAVWCGLALGVVTACGGSESSSASGGSPSATGGSSANGGSSGASGGGSSATGGSSAMGGSSATGGSAGASAAEPFPTGFGSPEVFVPALTRPVRLGFKSGFLYFTEMGLGDRTNSRLARRDAAGNVQTLFSGSAVVALFLDDDELFFVERGTQSVFRMKYATLTPELFAKVPESFYIGDIQRVGETMWMTEFSSTGQATGILSQGRSGGALQDVVPAADRGFIFTYLQVAAGQIYVSTQGGTGGGLFKGSATSVPVVSVPGIITNRLSADANFVYFGSESDGRILRQAHTATMSPEVIATGQSSPYAVTVDGGGIYWSNGPDCDPAGSSAGVGSVMGRAHAGVAPVSVASAERCPQAMTTDADFVYWIRENPNDAVGDDVIVRAKKLR